MEPTLVTEVHMTGDHSAIGLAEDLGCGAPASFPDATPDVGPVGPVWSEVSYEREAVAEIGAEAVCWVIYGELWEYRDGYFYVTELFHDRRRHLVEDACCAPPGPWRHHAACGCEVCRLGTV
jgi:hypothetical protein